MDLTEPILALNIKRISLSETKTATFFLINTAILNVQRLKMNLTRWARL